MRIRPRIKRINNMRVLGVLFTFHFSLLTSFAQGIPFFQNFLPEDYHGNSINFDIEIDNDGIVFLANFEGMMYFDHAQWRVLHTPGITRVTVTVKTEDGTIWVGGYNYFGRVQHKDNGDIYLQRIGKPDLFKGEVNEIYERDGKVRFLTREGTIYEVEGDSVKLYKKIDKDALKIGVLDIVDVDAAEKGEADIVKDEIIIEVPGDATSYYDENGIGVYKYQLTAVYENCESDFALTPDGENFVYIEVTGIEDNANDAIVNVLNVYNMKGQRIMVKDMSELNTGIYILQGLTEDGRMVSKKIVVNK